MEYLSILNLLALLFIGYKVEKLHKLLAERKSDWGNESGRTAQTRVFNEEQVVDDELYQKAREAVIKARKASTSYLQRKFGIGYSRAAHLIDRLEEEGVIGPADSHNQREVLE
jgi:DNA segregation ATPase FtsK/SpoIIIE-like protein